MAALNKELAEAKAARAQLVDIVAQFEVDTNKTRADFEDSKIRLGKVEQETKLAASNVDEALNQSTRSAEATEETLRQLTEVSRQAQPDKKVVSFLIYRLEKSTKIAVMQLAQSLNRADRQKGLTLASVY